MSNMTLSRKEKRAIRLQICRTLDTNCANCEKRKQAAEKLTGKWWNVARNELQKYCNTQCPIGKQLHKLGMKLVGEQERPDPVLMQQERPKPVKLLEVDSRSSKELTPESYAQDRAKGLMDWQIAMQYDISPSALYSRKSRWKQKSLLVEHA